MAQKKRKAQVSQPTVLDQAREMVSEHPIFSALLWRVDIHPGSDECPEGALAIVTSTGDIHMRATKHLTVEQCAYVIAHCLLHLAFNHFQEQYQHRWQEWSAACDCIVAKFLKDLPFGEPPEQLKTLFQRVDQAGFIINSEEKLFEEFCILGLPAEIVPLGIAAAGVSDMRLIPKSKKEQGRYTNWQECFAQGLQNQVRWAVREAGEFHQDQNINWQSPANREKSWFVANFPLLGALASTFKIIEDGLLCHRMDIRVAAVDMEKREIYINPSAQLTTEELRFVMAHELLHVGLRHDVRCEGRDHYLWNVACDYVINGWLIEMGLGQMPMFGGLYDPKLKGESADAIYDLITRDLRKYRRTITMRGVDQSDIISKPGWWERGAGVTLDEFYKSALSQGMSIHQEKGRGMLAAGLIEEINALSQPAVPWDVELAQWFDHYFPPDEKMRSYRRLNRRQSATPDIPRPVLMPAPLDNSRTFGVVLDTSGSMESILLAKALGSIASYSVARDVTAVRVIFCDAVTYDQGYLRPEDIAGQVKVRGRGGTMLQPGIDLLEQADDFPASGPILIITDGLCDRLHIYRDHAFLVPQGNTLPFSPKGPVFHIK